MEIHQYEQFFKTNPVAATETIENDWNASKTIKHDDEDDIDEEDDLPELNYHERKQKLSELVGKQTRTYFSL